MGSECKHGQQGRPVPGCILCEIADLKAQLAGKDEELRESNKAYGELQEACSSWVDEWGKEKRRAESAEAKNVELLDQIWKLQKKRNAVESRLAAVVGALEFIRDECDGDELVKERARLAAIRSLAALAELDAGLKGRNRNED